MSLQIESSHFCFVCCEAVCEFVFGTLIQIGHSVGSPHQEGPKGRDFQVIATVRISDGSGRKNRCTFLRPWCAKRLDEEVPLFARIWRGGRICLAVKGHILELAMDDH